jgi:hypothetical protein
MAHRLPEEAEWTCRAAMQVTPRIRGDLTDARARAYLATFTDCTWGTFDEYSSMFFNVSILHYDVTRPEKNRCTCSSNAKEFTCVHTLGVAMMKKNNCSG